MGNRKNNDVAQPETVQAAETTAAQETEHAVHEAAEATTVQVMPETCKEQKPCVYCGPSVRGVARQFTVYSGELPVALKAFLQKHPAARGLVVGMDAFAKTRSRISLPGTAEQILFNKIKSEL